LIAAISLEAMAKITIFAFMTARLKYGLHHCSIEVLP